MSFVKVPNYEYFQSLRGIKTTSTDCLIGLRINPFIVKIEIQLFIHLNNSICNQEFNIFRVCLNFKMILAKLNYYRYLDICAKCKSASILYSLEHILMESQQKPQNLQTIQQKIFNV